MKNPLYLKNPIPGSFGRTGLLAGIEFWELRHYKETVVVSEDFSEKIMLSQYLPSLKNTWGDTPIYIYDSEYREARCLFSVEPIHMSRRRHS